MVESRDELIRVTVSPKSRRPRVEAGEEGRLRVYVSSAPEKGKANTEAIKLVAAHLGVRKSRVRLASGATSREKTFRIERE